MDADRSKCLFVSWELCDFGDVQQCSVKVMLYFSGTDFFGWLSVEGTWNYRDAPFAWVSVSVAWVGMARFCLSEVGEDVILSASTERPEFYWEVGRW